MEISKTKIEYRLRHKTNANLVDAIIKLKKTTPEVAKCLATPRKIWAKFNLGQLNEMVKAGDKVLVPGKVLSSGMLDKKVTLVAWDFSEEAEKKLKAGKIEYSTILDEIAKNNKLNEMKILK